MPIPAPAPSRLTVWATRTVLAAGAAMVIAPLGFRVGLLPLALAFLALAAGALLLTVGAVTLLIRLGVVTGDRAALRDRRTQAALAVAAVVGAVPVWAIALGGGAPPIHDITTDLETPPAFVVAVAANPPGRTDYDPAVAAVQRAAYPDLAPVTLDLPPDAAYKRALAAVREMGWAVTATDVDGGRIEATDTSFWFGFTDDVVVRITPAGDGSRVDVRSLSRVGVGDLGANARRIRAYLAALADG